jgi:prepilin peptidase CpaA
VVEHGLHVSLFGALLAVAAATDLASRRVPNALVALLAASGLAAQWARDGATGTALGALAGLAVLGPLLAAWAAGKVGGGDAKLAAAAAVWLGPSRVLPFVVFAAVAGGPLALATRLSSQLALRRALARAEAEGVPADAVAVAPETVPLAVAIGLGALAALRWELP